MKKEIEKFLLSKIKHIINIEGVSLTGIMTREIPSIADELANLISSKQNTKFRAGDRARVCDNAGIERDDFLIHFLEIGKEVEIAGIYYGWKRQEAYCIKGSTEILLAGELEKI